MRQGDLRLRADVWFNLPIHQVIEKRIRTSPYPVSILGDKQIISKLVDGPFGTQIKVDDYRTEGIPVIRVSNCRENEINDDNLVYITPEHHERLLRSEVLPGDVVLTKTGNILGYAAVFPNRHKRANISSHLVLMRTTSRLNPGYLAAYLRTNAGQDQVYRWGQKATKPELNTIEIRKFLIPVPKPDQQKELLTSLNAARLEWQRKLKEADDLFTGLDGFVLDALGLTLPPPDGRMTYAVKNCDISSTRLDAHFYTPQLRKAESAIRALPFGSINLSDVLREPPVNGLDARAFEETGRRYLRVQNVRPYELKFDDIKYVNITTVKDIVLKAGNILLTRKGTYGNAAIVPPEASDCLISSEVILLRMKSAAPISAEFLVAWLNSSGGQTLFFRYKSGGIMGHLTQDVVENVPIPLVPKDIQNKIVDEVARRREKARQLRSAAELLWNEAKRRFEEELLGPEPPPEELKTEGKKGGKMK